MIFVELNEYCLHHLADASPEEVLSWLKSHGYKIYDVNTKNIYVLPRERDRYVLVNLLCI